MRASVHPHAGNLERWLGVEAVASLSRAMRDFYHPIAVDGVPGNVRVMPGGDFSGRIEAGSHASARDRAVDTIRRINRNRFARMAMSKKQLGAFGSLSALITAGTTGGKRYDITFNKVGVASNAIGNCIDLWTCSGSPAAGAAGAAAAAGTVPTKATAGAMGFFNAAVNANTTHFATGWAMGSVAPNTLLLYDRLFQVAKTMNSTATEAVTGVPTRYTSTVNTNADYAAGNFLFPSNPTTILAATAHNWTVCKYTNQDGTAGQTAPSIAGVSAGVVHGIDLAAQSWFMPLAVGDTGVKALTQMQASALVATGTIDFVIGHPISFLPCPIAQYMCLVDGINTAFNLNYIFDNACLALLEMPKPATTATTYNGLITTVSE